MSCKAEGAVYGKYEGYFVEVIAYIKSISKYVSLVGVTKRTKNFIPKIFGE